MDEASESVWPSDDDDFASAARAMFIKSCIGHSRYWLEYAIDLVTKPKPDKPYVRSWNEVAKRDRAYREAFVTLNDEQRVKVLELLDQCIDGAVYSVLLALDQFPQGEAEIAIWDGVCGTGKRKAVIAPTDTDLHKEYIAAKLDANREDG